MGSTLKDIDHIHECKFVFPINRRKHKQKTTQSLDNCFLGHESSLLSSDRLLVRSSSRFPMFLGHDSSLLLELGWCVGYSVNTQESESCDLC